MTGGILQLVAKGIEDIYLTNEPHITFFKIMHKRYTNFSIEQIKQEFINVPNFGKKTSCIVSKNGDLMGNMYLVVELPQIIKKNSQLFDNNVDNITKFAWIKKVGFALINKIELEINGKIIDKQYGEWLNIWSQLTNNNINHIDRLIGNVDELIIFSEDKDSYVLYVPLYFWFCRSYNLALPLVSLQYTEIKINLELNSLDKCHLIAPTNYIEIENDFVSFNKFDIIKQKISQFDMREGIFIDFDIKTNRLYYNKISEKNFEALTVDLEENLNGTDYLDTICEQDNIYKIFSDTAFCYPKKNERAFTCKNNCYENINIKDCYLLIDYIYVDEDLRKKFANNKHEYLIEQLQFTGDKIFESNLIKMNLDFFNPVKIIFWMLQKESIRNKDMFNYTDSYYNGKSLINEQKLYLNNMERIQIKDKEFYNYIQPYQLFCGTCQEGINMYSFCLLPDKIFPSGSCNFTLFNNCFLSVKTKLPINEYNKCIFKAYALGYNIFRICDGIAGLLFEVAS